MCGAYVLCVIVIHMTFTEYPEILKSLYNRIFLQSDTLSRTEEPAKAGTCARDRRALQRLALGVHVKHSDLTCSRIRTEVLQLKDLTVKCDTAEIDLRCLGRHLSIECQERAYGLPDTNVVLPFSVLFCGISTIVPTSRFAYSL